MYSLANVYLVCVLLSGLFRSQVSGTPITKDNGGENRVNGRQCKPLKQCDFYQQFEEKNIPESLKTTIKTEVDRNACGLDIYGDVEKGK